MGAFESSQKHKSTLVALHNCYSVVTDKMLQKRINFHVQLLFPIIMLLEQVRTLYQKSTVIATTICVFCKELLGLQ